ncbi:uncharacterized protein LOC110734613 [Chenopodium quinoa]|uniref:uncharacterized protein LOC110734613 n=1 Tax=Chenopodium quinoa TaxID=63459 RepID=UPI000B790BF5|nr:uncharacterized protein LOC110734613 [Chenopodium quinoa]
MGFAQRRGCYVVMLTIMFIFLVTSFDEVEAIRPLKKDQKTLLLASLPKGPVPPSKSSPCTNIPKSGGTGRCTMEVNVAGRATKAGDENRSQDLLESGEKL